MVFFFFVVVVPKKSEVGVPYQTVENSGLCGVGSLWGEQGSRGLQGLGSLFTPAQLGLVEQSSVLQCAGCLQGLSGPDWSSPTVIAYGAGAKCGEGSSAHSSLDGGLSERLSRDSRFTAEIPGT